MNPQAAFRIWLEEARLAFKYGRGHIVWRHFPPEGDMSQPTLVMLAARIRRDVHFEMLAEQVAPAGGERQPGGDEQRP